MAEINLEGAKFETLALHAGQTVDRETMARGVPLHRTSSYVFRDTGHAANLFALKELGYIYTRLMNPTQDVLEKRLAALEGGKAGLALASGTAAIFYSLINLAQAGDEVVAANNLYGGTYTQLHDILPQLGIRTTFVDPREPANFDRAVNSKTRAIFLETIGNPALDVTDLDAVAAVARKHHLPLIVDNTFATPYHAQPIEHGADVVIHSLTKWIGGHGTFIGGAVVDAGRFDWTDPKFRLYNEPDSSYHGLRYATDLGDLNPVAFALRMRLVPLRNLGACLSPDNAWLALQGLETLALRMERHSSNALRVAERLLEHPKVKWLRYPGLPCDPTHAVAARILRNGGGGMIVFGIDGGKEAGQRFIEALRLFSHLANVGDAKSLAIHPATTTHSQLSPEDQARAGITPDLVRLSIGIENLADILADLEQALEKA
ncbi:MAG: O-acetylhomoserine aminocarboxypropyltransferase/cysteine synthase [Deltaproteobacteria bacterium]|nr:O-acetylhomoserine aminocarboxypropyltransferase/cysteine synthase [Deltaproteobacteria bacterium]